MLFPRNISRSHDLNRLNNWRAEMRKEQVRAAGIVLLTMALPCLSHAALYDRGHGLIYDSVLNITWVQDAGLAGSPMHWNDAEAWVGGLTFDGISGWRLPTLTPVAGG